MAEQQRLYRLRHPQAVRAREQVRLAVERGELDVPDRCPRCGDEPGRDRYGRRRLEFHHRDYGEPLAVVPLCRDCHVGEHRGAA